MRTIRLDPQRVCTHTLLIRDFVVWWRGRQETHELISTPMLLMKQLNTYVLLAPRLYYDANRAVCAVVA